MKSGITKKVVAFAISLAMLTGSIPANAEGTVSGTNLNVETLGNEDSSDVDVNLDQDEDENTGNTGNTGNTESTESTEEKDENGDPVEIVDPATPLAPAPGTDGSGSGSSTSNNAVDTEKETTPTTSGNSATPTISENTISGNSVSDNTVSDNTLSGNSLSGNQIEYITWSKTVDGVTITVSANKASVPEGTDLSVEQLDSVAVEVLENTIAEEEVQQNMVVKQYKAFDITLVNEGEPVIPSEEVKVTFTGDVLIEDKEKGDKLKVYHLDDSDTQEVTDKGNGEITEVATLNDMEGSVVGDSVVMETPHFSTYLIALTGDSIYESNLVKNDFVRVQFANNLTIYNDYRYASEDVTDWYDYYIQARVYVDDQLICNAPVPWDDSWNSPGEYNNFSQIENNYFVDISDSYQGGKREPNQPITVTPATGYQVSQVKFGTGTTYANSTRSSISVSSSQYLINLSEYKNDDKKNNYLEIFLSSNSTGTSTPPSISSSTKTASCVNWNDRIYEINLTARAIGTVTNEHANIVLVLDYSGSMASNEKTMEDAVYTFINNLRGTDTKIGVVVYSGSASILKDGTQTLFPVKTEVDVNTLTGKINNYTAGGSTRTDLALQNALQIFNKNSVLANKYNYTVLFTDGSPTNTNLSGQLKYKETTQQASILKSNLVELYTIYLRSNSPGYTNELNNANASWLTNWIASSKSGTTYSYSVSAAGGLGTTFKNIFDSINNNISATITDVIDGNFEIVGTPPTGSTPSVNGAGLQVLEWKVPVTDLINSTWTTTFQIRAKENFIGDNVVQTNGTGSGITLGTTNTAFPIPTVNVKAQYTLGNASDVIFKGEVLNTYLHNNSDAKLTALLTSATSYVDKNSAPINFTDTAKFDYEWYRDNDNDNIIDPGETIQSVNDAVTLSESISALPASIGAIDDAGVYKLRVKYIPATTTTASQANSSGHVVTSADAFADATYTVQCISGKITVTKQIDKAQIDTSQGDPIFGFKLTRYDGATPKESYYKYVRFDSTTVNTGSATLKAVFDNLPKGEYKLDEFYTLRYGSKSILDGSVTLTGNPCSVSGTTATYQMAVPADSGILAAILASDDKKVNGTATYVNGKTYTNNFSDSDVVVNKFTKDPVTGKISIQGDYSPKEPEEG